MKKIFVALLLLLLACNNYDDYSVITKYPVKSGDMYMYIDENGADLFLGKRFLEASVFRDGIALVKQNTKNGYRYGYLKDDGSYLIEPQFLFATCFSEGLAWVVNEGSYPVAIDMDGKIIVSMPKAVRVRTFHSGLAAFSIYQNAPDNQQKETWSFLNKNGEIVIDGKFDEVTDFTDGFCAVKRNGEWGVIDSAANLVINFEYERFRRYSNGKFIFIGDSYVPDENKSYLLHPAKKVFLADTNGTKHLTVFDDLLVDGENYMVSKDGKVGWIPNDANSLFTTEIGYKILPKYKGAYPFNNSDVTVVYVNGKNGVINSKGEYTVEPVLSYALPFNGQYSIVSVQDKYTFMDIKGGISKIRFDGVSDDLFNILTGNRGVYNEVTTDYSN